MEVIKHNKLFFTEYGKFYRKLTKIGNVSVKIYLKPQICFTVLEQRTQGEDVGNDVWAGVANVLGAHQSVIWCLLSDVRSNKGTRHLIAVIKWAHILFYFLYDMINPSIVIKGIHFESLLPLFTFCWWHHSRSKNTSWNPINVTNACESDTWLVKNQLYSVTFKAGCVREKQGT